MPVESTPRKSTNEEVVPIVVEKRRGRFLPSGRQTGRDFSPAEEGGAALKRADAKGQDSHEPEPIQLAVPIGVPGRDIQLSLDRDEVLDLMQGSLERVALKLGMLVASSLLSVLTYQVNGAVLSKLSGATHR
jgi:hypothetical protein